MIGHTISHYKILAEIGQGGMGVVYKAEDLKLGRLVAIKFLPLQQVQDKDAERRFINEARAASALDHPGIGVIHEIDQSADGRTFIVMGFYDGGSLRDLLLTRRPDLLEALDLAIQIASGLANAHEHGIVHRDIKPANILLDNDGRTKIIDFGLAKLADQTRVTKTGSTMGTVSYMSPEQARGLVVDERSDIFSLGVVLYELVSGRLPFEGEREVSVLYKMVNEPAEPLASHYASAPLALQGIIDKALAKDPADRYQKTADFLGDLELLRESLAPSRTATLSRNVLVAKVPGRSVLWRNVAIALAVFVLLGSAYVVFLHHPGPGRQQDKALAMMDFRDLATADDPTIAAGLTSLVLVGLVESSPIRIVSPEYLYDLRRRLFGADRGPIGEDQALEVARKSGASLLLSGQTAKLEDSRFVTWRLVDTANGKSVAADRVQGDNLAVLADGLISGVLPFIASESGVSQTAAATPVSDLTTASPQAYQYYVAGTLDRDAYKAQEAIRNFENAARIDSTFALAFFELSRMYYSGTAAGVQYDRAVAYARTAWRLRSHLGTKDRLRLEAWREDLDFHIAAAIKTFEELLARWPDDRQILTDYHQILFYYWYSDRALKVAEQGLKLYPDDLSFGLYYQIGLAYQKRMPEALAATRTYLSKHLQEPNAWDELGIRFLSMGLADSAETAFHGSLQIDPSFLPSQQGLGYCAYSRGEPDAAIAIFDRILQRQDLLPGQRVEIMTANPFWPGQSLVQYEAGRFQKALALFDAARAYVSDPVSEMRLDGTRNRLLLRMGRAAEVLQWAEKLGQSSDQRLAHLTSIQYKARALASLRRLDEARAAVDSLYALEPEWGGVARFEALKVSAEIALADGKPEAALQSLDAMVSQGFYDGGLYDIEYREAWARAQQMAGHAGLAVATWRDLLKVYGSHALGHYELGLLQEQLGRRDAARSEYTAFLTAWAQADSGLPQVADARNRLSALGVQMP